LLIFGIRFGHAADSSNDPLQLLNTPIRFKLQILAGLLALVTFTIPASAAPNRLTIASAFATRLPELGSQGVEVTRRINKKLGRQLSVTLYDPGKLAPPGRYLDPVIVGAINAAWSAPNLLINRDSIFGIFGGPPFGLPAADHMRWLAGPASIGYTAACNAIGLAAIPCGFIGGQAFAWTQNPIEAPDDLKAMRIGIVSPGLSAHVLRNAGAQVRASGPAALHVMALSGALNAVSLGPYHVDLRMRTHQVAGYAYAPNPLAPTYVLDLIFSLKRW
jgi:TRAP-type mannitol/chloroaromatic compound transport system substrate-binding protein